MNVLDFQKMKDEGCMISMVTCYDYSSAHVVEESNVDCILVGDRLAMTMHGYPTTPFGDDRDDGHARCGRDEGGTIQVHRYRALYCSGGL